MNYFKIVHSAVHAGVASVCWLVLENLDWLKAHIADYREYALPLILAGLVLLFRTSDFLSTFIVEKVPLISAALRRMLSGASFIEGDWPLVVVDMERLAPLYLGFLNIGFRDGQPYVHGDDWKMDGAHAHAFHSVQSMQRDHTLQYWYEQGASAHRPDMRGYTEIFFFPRNALAERHAGKFLDPKHTSDIRFYATRRRYRTFERRIRSKDEKLAAACELWSEIEPALPRLRERDISADFA